MKPLPPLNATRAFAHAARCGGFASAAAELGVTSAAISQHVRNLEAHLGKQLFTRNGNRIVLTEAGHALYPRVEALLGEFGRIMEDVRSPVGRTRLRVSASHSLAQLWLYPRLAGFDLAGVEIRSELDPIDFGDVDVRFTYGVTQYPEHASATIFADRIVPVCAPYFLSAQRRLTEIADRWLIHTFWGPAWADDPSWRAWFAQIGAPREASPHSGFRVDLTSHAVDAAAAGLGIALVPLELAKGDIEVGRLVVPHPATLSMDETYGAIWPHARTGNRHLLSLLRHLGVRGGL